MTGDVNLAHIRGVISGRYGRHEDVVIALDQVARAEAVIQAARELRRWCQGSTREWEAVAALDQSLAALEDCQ